MSRPPLAPADAAAISSAALRCAVLIYDLDPGTAKPAWLVLCATDDKAEARKCAADWLREHPTQEAHLFIREDFARAKTVIEWTKP